MKNSLQKLHMQISQQTKSIFLTECQSKYKNKQNQSQINTVLCSFSILDTQKYQIKVVATGFGTKSLPQSLAQENKGKVIKDMHAQILARRGFISYIVENLPKSEQENQLFMWIMKRNKHRLRQKYRIIMYTNQIFCGDCMIDEQQNIFSGAKPLKFYATKQIPQEKFTQHCLRTKPGRLDLPLDKRTLSLSCSDKVALWNVLGVQGKVLFNYVQPIYINKIIIQTDRKIATAHIQQGINFVKRINKLFGLSQDLINRKLFRIVVDDKQKYITKQFKINNPELVILKTYQQYAQNKQQKQSQNKFMQLCGIITDRQVSWLSGKTGLPQGVSIKKINKVSPFCSSQLYKNIKYNQQKQSNQNQQFKYHAVKDRIKLLFKQWTDNFRNKKE